jgi:hypothetical protein
MVTKVDLEPCKSDINTVKNVYPSEFVLILSDGMVVAVFST